MKNFHVLKYLACLNLTCRSNTIFCHFVERNSLLLTQMLKILSHQTNSKPRSQIVCMMTMYDDTECSNSGSSDVDDTDFIIHASVEDDDIVDIYIVVVVS